MRIKVSKRRIHTYALRVNGNVLTVDSRYNNYLLYSHDITQIRNIRRAIFLFCYRRNNELKSFDGTIRTKEKMDERFSGVG